MNHREVHSFRRKEDNIMMRFGRACQSFILCAIVLLIVQYGCAKKLTSRSEGHGNLREALDLQALLEDGHGILANVSQEKYCHREKDSKCLDNKEEKDDDDDEDNDEDDDEDNDEDDDDEKEKEEDDHKKHKGKHVRAKGISVNQMGGNRDPEVHIFFKPDDLQVGKTKMIYFSTEDPSKSPKLLSREEAERIPFTLKQLPTLLKTFSLPKYSPQAKAMKDTLKQCRLKAMKGESKFCATSFESLLDSARSRFGLNTPIKVLSTIHLSNITTPLQNYTVLDMKEFTASKMIACHLLPFPFVVYFCHGHDNNGYRLFEFSLIGQSGEMLEAPAVCHLDTSKWDADHLAFRFLQVKPGTSPVCHFFPSNDLLWVPLPSVV